MRTRRHRAYVLAAWLASIVARRPVSDHGTRRMREHSRAAARTPTRHLSLCVHRSFVLQIPRYVPVVRDGRNENRCVEHPLPLRSVMRLNAARVLGVLRFDRLASEPRRPVSLLPFTLRSINERALNAPPLPRRSALLTRTHPSSRESCAAPPREPSAPAKGIAQHGILGSIRHGTAGQRVSAEEALAWCSVEGGRRDENAVGRLGRGRAGRASEKGLTHAACTHDASHVTYS